MTKRVFVVVTGVVTDTFTAEGTFVSIVPQSYAPQFRGGNWPPLNRTPFTLPYLFWASWFPSCGPDLLPSKKSPFAFDYGSACRILRKDFSIAPWLAAHESQLTYRLFIHAAVHVEIIA
jgi:hypothetical protein